jgi:hypothetical protein
MQFTALEIHLEKDIITFANYNALYHSRLTQALQISHDRYDEVRSHFSHLRIADTSLGRLYSIPTLKALAVHILFGTIRATREGMTNRILRYKIAHDLIWFRVIITTKTKEVKVYSAGVPGSSATYTLFNQYKVQHDFYGYCSQGSQAAMAG